MRDGVVNVVIRDNIIKLYLLVRACHLVLHIYLFFNQGRTSLEVLRYVPVILRATQTMYDGQVCIHRHVYCARACKTHDPRPLRSTDYNPSCNLCVE